MIEDNGPLMMDLDGFKHIVGDENCSSDFCGYAHPVIKRGKVFPHACTLTPGCGGLMHAAFLSARCDRCGKEF